MTGSLDGVTVVEVGVFLAAPFATAQLADPAVRVLVWRGGGDKAFVAGTDIRQFAELHTGQDGVDYETSIAQVVDRLEAVRKPTVAVIRRACTGGGLALAAACDVRVADTSARFGVPIAGTLGNCLSANTISLLMGHVGPGATLDLLLRGRLLDAETAACGDACWCRTRTWSPRCSAARTSPSGCARSWRERSLTGPAADSPVRQTSASVS
ncbi:enoyl-CoA hydratase-related protein [Amycolatopsis thailandensis]|uniref:enoyl-CoA hydratase-related protein n=1 Tax=Amycolatopsis thailandensis TaxID=589330 RepID=UPI001FC9B99B|nr:enoyl-CoA hydratase-related protein [Amycolatopsis thailandensis]